MCTQNLNGRLGCSGCTRNINLFHYGYQQTDTLANSEDSDDLFVCLFDLILYVHSTIFQLCGTGLPGLNQY